MNEWQPIETAPDGESVLLAYKYGLGCAIGHRSGSVWYGHEGSEWGTGYSRFTHWMPLPEPPK